MVTLPIVRTWRKRQQDQAAQTSKNRVALEFPRKASINLIFLEKKHSSFHCQHQWCLLGTSVHRGDGTQRSAQHWCCLGFVTWADSSGFVDPKFQLFRFRCNLVRPPGACFLRLLGVRSAFPTGCRCTGRRFKEQPSSFTTKA